MAVKYFVQNMSRASQGVVDMHGNTVLVPPGRGMVVELSEVPKEGDYLHRQMTANPPVLSVSEHKEGRRRATNEPEQPEDDHSVARSGTDVLGKHGGELGKVPPREAGGDKGGGKKK